MKYWLYENKRISGPLDAEALMRRPGFSPRSLVCPADRNGQTPGDWTSAAVVPDLIGGPSRPPAPPPTLVPHPPGFDSERVASELDGVRRALAALEMRLLRLDEVETRSSAKSASQQAAVQERLERLSDAIAAQDVKGEATDAALASCRATMDELRDAIDEANTHIENAVRNAIEQAGAAREVEAVRAHMEGALRDGLAGLHRLVRAAEVKLDSVAGKAGGLEAAHAAQKAELEAAARRIVAENDPTPTLKTLHERIERLSHSLSDAQSRVGDIEERRRLDAMALPKLEALCRSAETIEGRLLEVEGRPGSTGPLGERVGALSASLEAFSSSLDELKAGLARLEARAAEPQGPAPAALPDARALLDAFEARLRELESRPAAPAAAPAVSSPEPSPALVAKVDGLATGLVAVQKRFVDLESREARLNSLGATLEAIAAAQRDLKAGLERLEARQSQAAPPAVDPRLEGMAETLGTLRERLHKLETGARTSPAGEGSTPRRAWTAWAAGSAAAAALAGGFLMLRGPSPSPPREQVRSRFASQPAPSADDPETIPTPAPEPAAAPNAEPDPASAPPEAPAAVQRPAPATPAAVPSPALAPAVPEPAAPAAQPPIAAPAAPKPRRAKSPKTPGFSLLAPPAEPAPASATEPPSPAPAQPPRPKGRAGKLVYSAKAAPAVPGEVRLLEVRLRKDGVTLKLSEPLEPKAEFKADPPRLVLDFAKAPSDLPPKDLGGAPPQILQLRVREADKPARLLWVEIQLDKPASYKLESKGETIRVSFLP